MADEVEPLEDDEDVSIRFALRNVTGEANEIELHTKILGMEGYLLVQAGQDDGGIFFSVEASHMDLEGVADLFEMLGDSTRQAIEANRG